MIWGASVSILLPVGSLLFYPLDKYRGGTLPVLITYSSSSLVRSLGLIVIACRAADAEVGYGMADLLS